VRVLVTGGAGFIGHHLIQSLLADGHDVECLDDFSVGHSSASGAKYYNMDIGSITEFCGDYQVCYHLAAKSRIQPSFGNPKHTIEINAVGTLSVLEWARSNKVAVVYAGSSSRHNDPRLSPYAMGKYIGEELCKMYHEVYGLDVVVCRFYNAYGPGEITDSKWAAVIGSWRRQCGAREALTIVGDGEQRRDFTHVDDIVAGLRLAAGRRHEDAWELSSGENFSMNEVARMFEDRHHIGTAHVPDQAGNYRNSSRTNSDALDLLGWNPTHHLREYVMECPV
jgi:UDP-glucose 4-epimerase